MGFFDRFKKSPDPEALRELLFDAAHDPDRLGALCAKHQDAIRVAFPSWRTVPEPIRGDPAAVARWGQGVVAVAQTFAAGGDDSLLAALQPPRDNPLVEWQDALAAGQQALEERRYDAAIRTLAEARERFAGLSGPHAERLMAITEGALGNAMFHAGQPDLALPVLQSALDRCLVLDDWEGHEAYLAAVFETYRYLGQQDEAHNAAERLATLNDRWRSTADRVRDGEPKNRVVVYVDDVQYEQDESFPLDGRIRFAFVRDRLDLGAAMLWVETGRDRGEEGDHAGALAAFEAAIAIDPYSADAHYLAGLSHLYELDYGAAIEAYTRCESIAPGWFQCRADLALAWQLNAAEVPHDVFLALMTVEGQPDPAEQLITLSLALQVEPHVGPVHLARGKALMALERLPEARGALEAAVQAGEPDVATRALVALAQCTEGDARQSHLERAVALNGNLTSAAMARVMLRL